MQCNCHPLSTLAVDKHTRLRCLSHAFVHVAAGLSFALKASYARFPSLSSWLFDTMTSSLQMIQYSATAPLSAFAVDKRNGFRVCHMLFVEGFLISNYPCQSAGAIPALSQWQGNSKSCLTTPVRVLEVKSSIPALLQWHGNSKSCTECQSL